MSDDKWTPANVPDLKQHFNGKPQEQDEHRKTASRYELEKLLKERENPVRNLDYLPDHRATNRLQERVRQEREQRIAYIEDLFDRHREKARDDFNIQADEYLQKQPEKTMSEAELNRNFEQQKRRDRGGKDER